MDNLPHRDYYLACQREGLDPEDYEGVPYPHPYIEIWIECRRHLNSMGVPALPQPEKGVLDQDADLMLAFDLLEEAQEEWAREEEIKRKNREAAANMGFSM